jgi:hypothetical protein
MKSAHIIILILLSTTLAYSQPKEYTCKWHSDKYEYIEGISNLEYLYDSEQKVFSMISNDDENLYINLKFVDNAMQRKILEFGLTIWIDPAGKRKKKLELKYPLEKMMDRPENPGNEKRGMGDDGFGNKMEELINLSDEIEIIGFDGSEEIQSVYAGNEEGIRGLLINNQDDELVYQLCIPINELKLSEPVNEASISILMESGYMEMQNSFESGSGGGPGGGGPGGGGPGGGSGGGPGGGGSSMGMGGGRPPMNGGAGPGSGGGNPQMQQPMQDMSILSEQMELKFKTVYFAKGE